MRESNQAKTNKTQQKKQQCKFTTKNADKNIYHIYVVWLRCCCCCRDVTVAAAAAAVVVVIAAAVAAAATAAVAVFVVVVNYLL